MGNEQTQNKIKDKIEDKVVSHFISQGGNSSLIWDVGLGIREKIEKQRLSFEVFRQTFKYFYDKKGG